MQENDMSLVFPPMKLPSGMEVRFKKIRFKERRHILKTFDKNSGYLLEEALAAYSLVSINGTPVVDDWARGGYVDRFDSWDLPDLQAYLEVFMIINSLDETVRERYSEEAKKMLGVGQSTPVNHAGTENKAPKGLKVQTG